MHWTVIGVMPCTVLFLASAGSGGLLRSYIVFVTLLPLPLNRRHAAFGCLSNGALSSSHSREIAVAPAELAEAASQQS